MSEAQPGILAPVPPLARYLSFDVVPDSDVRTALRALADFADGERVVVGIGLSAVRALGREIAGLKAFPADMGGGLVLPSTPAALWCWLRGDDRGELMHRSRSLERLLAAAFRRQQVIDAFRYDGGKDLTGYEDGTENPKGNAADVAALVNARGAGLDGSSFVAVQQWCHDFDRFSAMSGFEQDQVVGRRRSDNEELDDAPPSAHVKRTAQENFEPPAFVLRRSMPWADDRDAGLVFVAFGRSFAAFEAQLRRMIGADDGIVDAMFKFTRPVSGAYFWCPPRRAGGLDLGALGL